MNVNTKPKATIRRFKLKDRIGNVTGATVEIELVGETWIFRVRPKYKRETYEYKLADVADMVMYKAVKEALRRRT